VARFLAVADLHGRDATLQAVRKLAEVQAPDAVILAGDLTSYGSTQEVRRILDHLPGRVLAIPGNLDMTVAFDAAMEGGTARSLLEGCVEVAGVRVAGPPRRRDGEWLPCEVLVVHEPPRGVLDDAGGGRHIGLVEHLDAVRRLRPLLLLCGHCHESPGIEVLGGTTVVNCSAGRDGRGALVEIDGGRVVARML
jgi:hypothetical protein